MNARMLAARPIARGVARRAALGAALIGAVGCASSPQAARPPAASVSPAPRPDSTARADTAAAAMPAARAMPAPATAAPADSFPTQPPALGAVRPLTLPPVVERRLANGLRLLIVEHHELPLVDARLVVRSGAEMDPAAELGLATLTASLLDEGAGGRDALGIADQVAYLGIGLGTGSGFDMSTVSLHAPTARLDSALALFADVALRPTFPPAELERLRQDRLTSLIQLRDRGPAIADRVFPAVLYGDDHPYGRPLTGTEATTKAITRADVQRFYDSVYRPNNATLIVVGDVAVDDIVRRAERVFGAWEARPVTAPRSSTPPAAGTSRVYVVDKPGAAQSSVRIGAVGVARSTPDYFPLLVMNTILGGSFTSRLNQNLRETHGYTYGARSGFAMRTAAGPFLASAEVVAAKTDSSLIEFFRELRAIRDTVPAEELEKARRFLQLQLPGDFETTGDIAAQLVPIALYDLPLDYYGSYSRRIGAVSQADVQRVARRYVDPDRLSVVIVGDRTSIEPTLRSADIAPLTVLPIPPG
ncbi:MAG: M16 family metallopeptidase [Gemmatimonadaceae bacterium]